MKPINECKTVAELLCDESRWTKGSLAKANDGEVTGPGDPGACRFCLLGAVVWVYATAGDARRRAFQSILDVLGLAVDDSIGTWNDHPDTTFADIRRVIEAAGV